MWNRAAAFAARARRSPRCRAQPSEPRFPEAHRDVAPIVGDTFSTEDARDRLGEAEEVMDAGRRQARHVGRRRRRGRGLLHRPPGARWSARKGRVLAEDIVPEVRD